MNNILLIIKRTYQTNFNQVTKILLGLLAFFFATSIFTGLLVLEKGIFPNNFYLNLALNGKNIVITLFVFFIIKQIQKDLKKRLFKKFTCQ